MKGYSGILPASTMGPDSWNVSKSLYKDWQKNLHYCCNLLFSIPFFKREKKKRKEERKIQIFCSKQIAQYDLSLFIWNRELGPFAKAFHRMLKTEMLHTILFLYFLYYFRFLPSFFTAYIFTSSFHTLIGGGRPRGMALSFSRVFRQQ
jgi:hypothetical protein